MELKSVINPKCLNMYYNRGIISTTLTMAPGHVFIKSCPAIPPLVAYYSKNHYVI